MKPYQATRGILSSFPEEALKASRKKLFHFLGGSLRSFPENAFIAYQKKFFKLH